jgi:hypothetical protein
MPKQQQQQQQMMNIANYNVLATRSVSGANELNKYIQGITEIKEEIRQEFEDCLIQPDAIVEYDHNENRTQFTTNIEMSAESHRTFINYKTKLFLQTGVVIVETLNLLEILRKMLVNNKQQKKTTIRNIRSTINGLKQQQLQWTTILNPEQELEAMTAVTSPSIERLEKEIEMTKQNHRTITNRILTQVNSLCITTRRNILNFKRAAEETIGEIIIHADKCRAFILKCRRLEIIEFCASNWWFDTCYWAFITEHPELSDHQFTVSAEQHTHPNTISGWSNDCERIKIVVKCFNPTQLVHTTTTITICEYELDQTLAEEILTDDAIQAFEDKTTIAKEYPDTMMEAY